MDYSLIRRFLELLERAFQKERRFKEYRKKNKLKIEKQINEAIYASVKIARKILENECNICKEKINFKGKRCNLEFHHLFYTEDSKKILTANEVLKNPSQFLLLCHTCQC
ncbi:MAG: hypothetical protein ACREBA_01995 [Nitrosotalea sp.]